MILVTGATGLSGSAVIREFGRQKALARALIRSHAKARAFETFPTVERVEGDMLRPETLGTTFRFPIYIYKDSLLIERRAV